MYDKGFQSLRLLKTSCHIAATIPDVTSARIMESMTTVINTLHGVQTALDDSRLKY